MNVLSAQMPNLSDGRKGTRCVSDARRKWHPYWIKLPGTCMWL